MADIDIKIVSITTGVASLVFSGRGILSFYGGDFRLGAANMLTTGANVSVSHFSEWRFEEDTDVYATVFGSPATSYPMTMLTKPLPHTAKLVVDCG